MTAPMHTYAALLRMKGIPVVVTWVSLGRLVYGMAPLAFLLLLAQQRDSFADAGIAIALYGLAAGALGPARARLTDRYGPRWTMSAMAGAFVLAIAGLIVSADAPLGVMLIWAVLAGAVPPPVGPLMRVTWRRLVGADEDLLRRAYAFDSVAEELIYVVGPLAATAAVAWLGAAKVLFGSALLLLVAAIGLGLAVPRTSDPSANSEPDDGPPKRLRVNLRFLIGLTPIAGLSFLLGALEVSVVAAAVSNVGSDFAGVPAATLTVGSVVGGLIYGRRTWPGSSSAQVRVLVGTSVAFVVLSALAISTFWAMLVLLLAAGFCIAPAIVCSYLIADEATATPNAESTAWVNSGYNLSLAAGSAFGGVLVDASSAKAGMLLAALIATAIAMGPGLLMRSTPSVMEG